MTLTSSCYHTKTALGKLYTHTLFYCSTHSLTRHAKIFCFFSIKSTLRTSNWLSSIIFDTFTTNMIITETNLINIKQKDSADLKNQHTLHTLHLKQEYCPSLLQDTPTEKLCITYTHVDIKLSTADYTKLIILQEQSEQKRQANERLNLTFHTLSFQSLTACLMFKLIIFTKIFITE